MTDSARSVSDAELERALAGLPAELRRFQQVYVREVRPKLLEREAERVKAADTARLATWLAVAGGLIGGGLGFIVLDIPILGVIAIGLAVLVFAVGRAPLGNLERQAKVMLVQPVAERFGLTFQERIREVASVRDLRRAGLLPSYDRASFEDRLTGERNDVAFEFFEAHLKERRTTRSNGRTQTRYVTVFKGQCLRFDFHKRFFGETLVTRDLGFFNRFAGRPGMDRARLEDPEFEKAYEVYTTDQVEARFILTPDFMQKLVDLETTFHGKKLRCAFVGQEMLIAVEGGDLFEPGSLFTPLDNPDRLRELLQDFAVVFNLIDTVRDARAREEVAREDAPPSSRTPWAVFDEARD